MTQKARLRIIFMLMTMTLLAISAPIVFSQGQNLLTNPGFEQPFDTLDGVPPRQVARGWVPWHIAGGQSSSENVQPEYYPATDATNGLGVPRFRNGSDAQQYHSFFATHDGGLLQRVSGVSSGTALRFSAYVYVWSSTFDDPNRSEQPGGVIVQVGIDPQGGTDPNSQSIVWSTGSVNYDTYSEYSVVASAAGSSVTVYVRTTSSVSVKSTNIYVDDAVLVAINAIPATSTPTASTGVTVTPLANVPASPTAEVIVPVVTFTSTLAQSTNTPVRPAATNTRTAASATAVPATSTRSPSATNTSTRVPPSPTSVPAVSPTVLPPTGSPTPTQEVLATATQGLPVATATPLDFSAQFPGRLVHIVQSGDTVGRLAELYGSSVEAIIAANGLGSSAFIRVGQALFIPVRLTAPATSTPTATPDVLPVVSPTTETNVPVVGELQSYTVRAGDTLGRIAARFNTTVGAIVQLNGITNPNLIRAGQTLQVPSDTAASVPPGNSLPPTAVPAPAEPQRYTVRPGDTLFRIAARFGVSAQELALSNNIRNANLVFVGQVLIIP